MHSFILRFILGVFSLVGVARMSKAFNEPKEKRDKRHVNFFWFFFFLALHQFAWSVPFLWFKNVGRAAFWSYEAAILFYYLLLYFALRTLSYLFPQNNFLRKNIFGGLTLLAGAVVVTTQFFSFNLPVIKNELVVWQSDIYLSLVNGLFGFFTAMVWVYMFYKYMPKGNKISAVLLFFGALFLGLSCFVFFIFKEPWASVTTFSLIVAGLLCGLTSFYWPKEKEGESK